jgi:hypothetical protein
MRNVLKKTFHHIFGAGLTPYIFVLALSSGVAGGIISVMQLFAPYYISQEVLGLLMGLVIRNTLKISLIIMAPIALLSICGLFHEYSDSPKGSDATKRTTPHQKPNREKATQESNP